MSSSDPLSVEEVIACLRRRWGVTYHLRLLRRNNRIYIQMMWRYLEQKSFPLDEASYNADLNNTLEIVNRVGQAQLFRHWLNNIDGKPRLGNALTLPLRPDQRLEEFVLPDLL